MASTSQPPASPPPAPPTSALEWLKNRPIWNRFPSRLQRTILWTPLIASIVVTVFGYYDKLHVNRLWEAKIYQATSTDRGLERFDFRWADVPGPGKGKCRRGPVDGIPAMTIPPETTTVFVPGEGQMLKDFHAQFQIVVRGGEREVSWLIRTNAAGTAGYRFHFLFPQAAAPDAKFWTDGGACSIPADFIRGEITPGHLINVDIEVAGSGVRTRLYLAYPRADGEPHDQAGESFAVGCEFRTKAATGLFGFQAGTEPLIVRNFNLVP